MRGKSPWARWVVLGSLSTVVWCSAGRATGDEDDVNRFIKGLQASRAPFHLANALQKITREDEYYIGRAAAAMLLEQYEVYEDAAATRYLNVVGRSLTLVSKRKEVFDGYRFIILDSPEVNAFAVPGAFVFLTRGMLQLAKDEDMLAAVLAHEIAHLQAQHGHKLIKERQWEQLWNDVLTAGLDIAKPKVIGKLTGFLTSMSGELFKALYGKGYEKAMDLEADVVAIGLLNAVGYDAYAMIEVLRAMEAAAQGPGFTRTHPKPQRRIENIEASVPSKAQPRPGARQERFEQALRRARAAVG